jgi:hypothetical protein
MKSFVSVSVIKIKFNLIQVIPVPCSCSNQNEIYTKRTEKVNVGRMGGQWRQRKYQIEFYKFAIPLGLDMVKISRLIIDCISLLNEKRLSFHLKPSKPTIFFCFLHVLPDYPILFFVRLLITWRQRF